MADDDAAVAADADNDCDASREWRELAEEKKVNYTFLLCKRGRK